MNKKYIFFILILTTIGCETNYNRPDQLPYCVKNPYRKNSVEWYKWEDVNYKVSCSEVVERGGFFNRGDYDPVNMRDQPNLQFAPTD